MRKIKILMMMLMLCSVSMAYTWPTGVVVNPGSNSDFGPRNISNGSKNHMGIDIGVPSGTKCLATADGTVVNVAYSNARGHYIDIDIGNGYVVRYQHLSKILFAKGAKVKEGQSVALSGNSGRGTNGKPYAAHLHYEVLKNGTPIDPVPFLKSAGSASTNNTTQVTPINRKYCSECKDSNGEKKVLVGEEWYLNANGIHYRICSQNNLHHFFEEKLTKCTGTGCELCKKTVQPIFTDFNNNHWAANEIIKLKDAGIVNGNRDGSLKPDDPITIEEFVNLMSVIIGKKGININCGQSEVYLGDKINNVLYNTFAKALGVKAPEDRRAGESVLKNILVTNSPNGEAGVTQRYTEYPVTREEIAYILSEFIDAEGKNSSVEIGDFTDWNDVEYKSAINILYELKVFKGRINKDGTKVVAPKDTIKRVEAMALLARAMDNLK